MAQGFKTVQEKTLNYTRTKFVECADGIRRSVEIDTKDYRVTLLVDADAILRNLGPRAINNKAGKTRYMHGALIVEAKAVQS